MRKVIWCCAAVAVATAGGTLWAAGHAQRHPESFVGRCFTAASYVAVAHPLLSHGKTAVHSVPAATATPCCPACEECTEACEAVGPGTPRKVTLSAELNQLAGQLKQMVVGKAPLGGEIVIKEEETPSKPALQAELVEEALPAVVQTVEVNARGVEEFSGDVECGLEACLAAPKFMPPAVEDADPAPAIMPYFYEDDPVNGGHAIGAFLRRALETKSAVYGGSEEAEVFFGPGKPTDCKIDPAYHEQYPGCPAAGKCPAPTANEKNPKPKTCDECPDGKCPKPMSFLQKLLDENRGTDDCPVHRGIDTTEVRPSDLGPNARTGSIPF